ncbi:MAG: flagellar protein FlaG [Roseburia sp.]|nr:flagellar protein FlaG [Roseburia sp.]
MGIENVKSIAQASYQRPVETAEVKVENTSGSAEVQQSDAQAAIGVQESAGSNQQMKGDSSAQQNTSNAQIKKAVEEINKKANNSEAVFGVHDKTNRVTIKIVDKDTKETIKEFPPEKTLDMIAKVWEMAGLLVDEKR